ncbi:MAG: hypothetical protein LWW86_15055 [Micrococcales bacterium]|nr:hypothetical protein [Micrococcales bacterium]
MKPLRTRLLPIIGLMLGAPICAEYLQAYLPDTGDIAVMVFGLVILGPLYGGAALLIREIALRTGRGWPGILLLGAAFGLRMTGLVDGSMWQEHRPEVPYWDELRRGTLISGLGFAAFPVMSWVGGHMLFSIGAPLALLDALTPQHRGRPLLGRIGLIVVTGLCLIAAASIRFGEDYEVVRLASPATGWTLAAIALLTLLAFTRLGRPLRARPGRRRRPPIAVAVTAFLALALVDIVSMPTWTGAVLYAGALAVIGVILTRVSQEEGWGVPQVTALAVGAIIERVLMGLLAPLPEGVTATEKTVQSAVLIAGVALISAAAWRRGVAMPAPLAAPPGHLPGSPNATAKKEPDDGPPPQLRQR